MPSSFTSTATGRRRPWRRRRGRGAGGEHRQHRAADLEAEAGRRPRRRSWRRRRPAWSSPRAWRPGGPRRAARPRRRPPPPGPARRGRPARTAPVTAPRSQACSSAVARPSSSATAAARAACEPEPASPAIASNVACDAEHGERGGVGGWRERADTPPAEARTPLAQGPAEVGRDGLDLLGRRRAQQARRSRRPWPCGTGWPRPHPRWRRRLRAARAHSDRATDIGDDPRVG